MIPQAPGAYSKDDQSRTRETLRQMDTRNRKKGEDLEVARGERLILTDTVTAQRYEVSIQSGAVVLVAL